MESKAGMSYSWTPSQDPVFFPGRQAVVHAGTEHVGAFGIVHPEVSGEAQRIMYSSDATLRAYLIVSGN